MFGPVIEPAFLNGVGPRPPVILLRPAAHLPGTGRRDQARFAEHLEVMGDVALVAAEGDGELADRRRLSQREEQPLAQRMGERLEVLWGVDVHRLVGHALSVKES